MDKPTPADRIHHVLMAIQNIKAFMKESSVSTFSEDSLLQSAVKYEFLIIGEAIKHIDPSILERYPYPWHIPKSFRNFIIHAYHGIRIERIYYATGDLEELQLVMQTILEKEF